MPKKKVVIEPYEDTAKWLCTFNDLMTLLLTFFVLLLSMSSLDAQKVKDMQSALQSALGVLEAGKGEELTIMQKIKDIEHIGKIIKIIENIYAPGRENIKGGELEEGESKSQDIAAQYILKKQEGIKEKIQNEEKAVYKQLHEAISQEIITQKVSLSKRKRGVVLSLKDKILFTPGDALLNRKSLPVLKKIARILKGTSYNISIEGHTDDTPVHTERFPSNWELSVARAVSVARYFIDKTGIKPSRIAVVGYGPSMPAVPNNSKANRAKNRRIEIVLSQTEQFVVKNNSFHE